LGNNYEFYYNDSMNSEACTIGYRPIR